MPFASPQFDRVTMRNDQDHGRQMQQLYEKTLFKGGADFTKHNELCLEASTQVVGQPDRPIINHSTLIQIVDTSSVGATFQTDFESSEDAVFAGSGPSPNSLTLASLDERREKLTDSAGADYGSDSIHSLRSDGSDHACDCTISLENCDPLTKVGTGEWDWGYGAQPTTTCQALLPDNDRQVEEVRRRVRRAKEFIKLVDRVIEYGPHEETRTVMRRCRYHDLGCCGGSETSEFACLDAKDVIFEAFPKYSGSQGNESFDF